jgi:hypothetical protein
MYYTSTAATLYWYDTDCHVGPNLSGVRPGGLNERRTQTCVHDRIHALFGREVKTDGRDVTVMRSAVSTRTLHLMYCK